MKNFKKIDYLFFEKKLKEEKKKILNEMRRYTKQTEAGFKPRHIEIGSQKDDTAKEFEIYEQNLTIEENLKERLEKINKALGKIKTKKYGICENCNNPIERKRLELLPEARHCSSCHKEGLVD